MGREVRKCWISDLYVMMDRSFAVLMNIGAMAAAAVVLVVCTTGEVAMEVEKEGRHPGVGVGVGN